MRFESDWKMKPKLYDTVGKYDARDSAEALQIARKQLMGKPAWPLCVPHWKPFSLGVVPNGPAHYEVYLKCMDCLQDRFNETINQSRDNTQTEDLLG